MTQGEREELAGRLGARLVEGGRVGEGMLAYIVAGDMDRTVEAWIQVRTRTCSPGHHLTPSHLAT